MYKSVVNYFFGMKCTFSAYELSVGYDPYQKETVGIYAPVSVKILFVMAGIHSVKVPLCLIF